MSLYERKVVPFRHDDDSDEDVAPSKKRKMAPVAPQKKLPVVPKSIVDISFDDEEEEDESEANNRILKELEAKKKIVIPVASAPVIVDIEDDEVVAKAQKLLQKSQSAKSNKISTVEIVDLDDVDPVPSSSSYVAPKIARANERRVVTNPSEDSGTIDYLRNLTQSASSNSNHAAVFIDDSTKLKLVTRLNGQHEWKWKVPSNDPFSKMKKKFAEIYGVSENQFKFIFDGSVLSDKETPEDVEMEDSNIIDVKMDEKLYKNAVAAASNYAKSGSAASSSSSGSSSSNSAAAPPVDDTPKVKLVTRLNGEHEWKWKVPVSEPFSKMKKKFAEIYGVKEDQFKFIFDGSVLGDKETPEDVEMEDSNIIDVKMDKTLYKKAITSADKAKA